MAAVTKPARDIPIQRRFISPPDRPKRQLRLFFPKEALALHTQFRADALNILYWAAEDALGERLHSANIQAWDLPGEEDSEYLLLSVVADASMAEMDPVGDSMFFAIREEAESWTDEEFDDYARRVYFELVPLTV